MIVSREEILSRLQADLEEMFEVPRDKIVPEARLYDDLGLDSIDAVDLIVKLGDLTGRKIRPEAFKAVRTVADVVNCVEATLTQSGEAASDAPA